MKKSTRKFALGTITAAVAGYFAGILTAPKSGKETRGDIKDAASAAVAETEKQLKKLHTELNDLIGSAKDKGEKLSGRAKDEYETVVATAQLAKGKARELLSALHEGDADDKDLQKAIEGATDSIKHLKTYLAKHA